MIGETNQFLRWRHDITFWSRLQRHVRRDRRVQRRLLQDLLIGLENCDAVFLQRLLVSLVLSQKLACDQLNLEEGKLEPVGVEVGLEMNKQKFCQQMLKGEVMELFGEVV